MIRLLTAAILVCLHGGGVVAQTVISDSQRVAFASPEGWAMATTVASTLNIAMNPPRRTEVLAWVFTAELGSIPNIDAKDTRVGFGGFKLEDLNKSPVFGRATLHVGLPADFTVALSWTPPVEIEGARPERLFGVTIERPLLEHAGWEFGARVFAQWGDGTGDVTCSSEVVASPPGSAANPFGCRSKSRDTIKLDHQGAEFLVSRAHDARWRPFAALAVARMRPQVQIRAHVYEVLDLTRIRARGTVQTLTLGTAYRLSDSWSVSTAVSYTPLDVRRPSASGRQSDDFWSARLGISWHGSSSLADLPGAR